MIRVSHGFQDSLRVATFAAMMAREEIEVPSNCLASTESHCSSWVSPVMMSLDFPVTTEKQPVIVHVVASPLKERQHRGKDRYLRIADLYNLTGVHCIGLHMRVASFGASRKMSIVKNRIRLEVPATVQRSLG